MAGKGWRGCCLVSGVWIFWGGFGFVEPAVEPHRIELTMEGEGLDRSGYGY